MKTTYSIFILLLLSFTSVCFAQTHYENLKEADKQRALTNERNKESDRQNAHNNRAFERNTPNATNSNIPTSNSTWGMTGRYEREQKERAASDAKNQKLLGAYEAKVAVIKNCFKTLGKTKDNYEKICNCALSNGVDYNTTYRVVGFSAEEFQMNIDRENDEIIEQQRKTEIKTTTIIPTQKKIIVFTGSTINGKKQGKGIHTDSYGRIIEGEFVDDLVDGYATEKGPYGGIYEGYFENGVKKGKGKTTFSNGGFCEGNYENGAINGYMVCINNKGDKYEGNSVNDRQDGKGKSTYADGSIYEGNFKQSYKSGYGVYRYKNGDVYEGDFDRDLYNGNGKFIKKSGFYVLGIFKDNSPEKVKYYNPSNEKVSKSEYEKN